MNYESFTFFHSIGFLLMVILGGTGTLLGPVVGAATLTYVVELLQIFREWQIFAYGILLIVIMFAMPRGVVGTIEHLLRRLGARPAARGPGVAEPRRAPGRAAGPQGAIRRDGAREPGGSRSASAASPRSMRSRSRSGPAPCTP